uniref:N-terminal Xaa-Pro-Lys N-methyltransferase 1 n=1 Tax=Mustela putorius furo TaxID=9669 RepID=M3YNB7_MUSPF
MTSEVIEDEKQFYSKAKTYWKEVPPTVDGMLGGYGHISSIDISSSRKFLQRFLRVGRSGMPSRSRGCGPGGPAWSAQGAAFYPSHHGAFGAWLVSAPQALRVGRGGVRLGASVSGLPRVSPNPPQARLPGLEWVGHLTDQHLAEFLRRCKQGLRPNGIIVIKDNMAQEGVILDDVDSSVCRDLEVVHRIVRSAGLSLLAQERQENLPDEIYHVYSLALR